MYFMILSCFPVSFLVFDCGRGFIFLRRGVREGGFSVEAKD